MFLFFFLKLSRDCNLKVKIQWSNIFWWVDFPEKNINQSYNSKLCVTMQIRDTSLLPFNNQNKALHAFWYHIYPCETLPCYFCCMSTAEKRKSCTVTSTNSKTGNWVTGFFIFFWFIHLSCSQHERLDRLMADLENRRWGTLTCHAQEEVIAILSFFY